MALGYLGYLVKVGNYTIPMDYINIEGYSAKVNTLDEDSYTDNNGVLQRTVIQHIPIVQVELVELDHLEFGGIMQAFRNNYSVDAERRATVSVWVPEYGDYVVQDMYLSDPEIAIKEIDAFTGIITYKPITLKFNGYGE